MLKLGLPSKGRLMEKAFDWFGDRGNPIALTGGAREYAAAMDSLPGVEIVMLSAGEIPRELAEGRIHLGVTGTDMVRERIPAWETRVTEVTAMGFGHATLVIAVPAFWADVATLEDLDAVAAEFRARHGHRLRVATKYHRMVREFLRDAGVADYHLVDSQGATEGTVKAETAEVVADITSTGETLRANHLRQLDDGVIHASQATLFRSRTADWSGVDRDTAEQLYPGLGATDA